MPVPQDLNPDPNVLEIELEARIEDVEIVPGFKTPAWTYNGTVPGPMIRAKLGDRVIVHFKNSLPEATTIHWHGLRVPNEMDGAPGVTQPPIESGGEFRYEFELRDAGTYWYHPHTDSSTQVGRGLYGAFIVEDPADPEAFGDDLVMLLSDMGLDERGELLPADSGGNFGDLFGREGAVLLVNGKVRPTLKVRNGKQQRWRLINATRARYYNVRLRNHRFMRLGGDNGLAARSAGRLQPHHHSGRARRRRVHAGRSAGQHQRAALGADGTRLRQHVQPPVGERCCCIETVADAPVTPEPIPTELRTIEPLDLSSAKHRTLDLTIAIKSKVEMGVNGVPYWNAKPLEIALGDTEVWRIVNNTDFSHPFHLHGYFFQVQDDARVPEWKDTVNVPTKSELTIAVRFDERPGAWMYHCHILDHAEAGMMGHLVVRDPNAPQPLATPAPHHH